MKHLAFRPEMMEAVLDGRKRVTRRYWKEPRFEPGERVLGRCQRKPFAILEIISIQPSSLDDIGQKEAELEGFSTSDEVLAALEHYNPPARRELPLWRVEFKVVEKKGGAERIPIGGGKVAVVADTIDDLERELEMMENENERKE